jgi:hypothetical protein
VSMRLFRRVMAAVALGLALASLALASSPALADQVRNHEWWLAKLHVTDAWQSSRGAGITVAVLDTGVASTQPDLVGSVISGPDYTNSGRPAGGPFWGAHGTAIASLIVGHGHGPGAGDGIVGIAPQAKVLSVRVTLESRDPLMADPAIAGKLPLAIAHGIKFAVQHGASVIDLPLDPQARPGAAVAAGAIAAERAAVAYAVSKHVVLVAPAGDVIGGTDRKSYPAAFPGVISVGAFNSQFVKAKYSSHQSYVTVTAAGDGVMAASPTGYVTLHSTSAASAVVAGIVALIRTQFPTLTPAQVTKVLTSSTVYRPSGGQSRGSGYGTVDAARALAAAAQMVELVPSGAPGSGTSVAPPTPPSVYSLNGNLRKTLMIDAAISAAVFLVLLMIILIFRQLRRRRARAARLAEVRAAARVQARRSKEAAAAGATGFMPAPVGRPRPSAAGSLFAGSGLPGTGLPASGLSRAGLPGVADAGAPGAALAGPAQSGVSGGPSPSTGAVRPPWEGASSALPENMPPAAPGGASGDPYGARPGLSGGSPGGLGLGPSRAGGTRVPKVSGSPPWEPAEKPDTELPWVQSARPAGGASPVPPRPEPEEKSWDSIAEEAWPGGPRSAAPHPPVKPPAAASPYTPTPYQPTVNSAPSTGPAGTSETAWREQDQAGADRQAARWDTGLTAASFSSPESSPRPEGARALPSWGTTGAYSAASAEGRSYRPGSGGEAAGGYQPRTSADATSGYQPGPAGEAASGYQLGSAPEATAGYQPQWARESGAGYQLGSSSETAGGYQPGTPADAAGGYQPGTPADAAGGYKPGTPADAASGYQPGSSAEAIGGYQPGTPADAASGYQPGSSAEAIGGYQPGPPADAASGYQPGPSAETIGGYQPGTPADAASGYQLGPSGETTSGNQPGPSAEAMGGYQPGASSEATGGYQPDASAEVAGGYQPGPVGETGPYGGGATASGGYSAGEAVQASRPYSRRQARENAKAKRTPPRGPHGESTEILPTVRPEDPSDAPQ